MNKFSAYTFTNKNDLGFDPTEYSKFKFGCKDAARKFGTELAQKFIANKQFKEIVSLCHGTETRIVVLSSPFVHIPTATFAMKDYFIRVLNAELIKKSCEPVMECKIYRRSSYKEEYGEMNKEERFAVMANDDFYVDANFIKGKICLFLDDIIITGAHEHRILNMLHKFELTEHMAHYFLYFAELKGTKANPNIENYLNYYFVKNLNCLDKIIKNEEYLMNTRVIKYILNANHEECKIFIQYQKHSFVHTLYHNAIGNGYHKIEDYALNLNYIKQQLK